MEETTVLIVDDSSLTRRVLRRILEPYPEIRIVGEAANGSEAIQKAVELRPRVVTMDLQMPGLNGLEAIERIMAVAPTRILVLTETPNFGGLDGAFESLSRGALELMLKPALSEGGELFVSRLKELSTVPVMPHFSALAAERKRRRRNSRTHVDGSLFVIGASTGGPGAIAQILEVIPEFPAPIVVTQHLSDAFAESFVEWLRSRTQLKIDEAKPGPLVAGRVSVAIRGPHVVVTRGAAGELELKYSSEPPRGGHRPSIDTLFESAAEAAGSRAVGILLSGMGRDGAMGLKRIRDHGGWTIAQSEQSCVVYGMPKVATEFGAVSIHLTPPEIGEELLRIGVHL